MLYVPVFYPAILARVQPCEVRRGWISSSTELFLDFGPYFPRTPPGNDRWQTAPGYDRCDGEVPRLRGYRRCSNRGVGWRAGSREKYSRVADGVDSGSTVSSVSTGSISNNYCCNCSIYCCETKCFANIALAFFGVFSFFLLSSPAAHSARSKAVQ